MSVRSFPCSLDICLLLVAKFNQLEALSIPGSGLKFLDMPDMATLVSHPMTSSSTENNSSLIGLDAATPPRVRLYGSEQDM